MQGAKGATAAVRKLPAVHAAYKLLTCMRGDHCYRGIQSITIVATAARVILCKQDNSAAPAPETPLAVQCCWLMLCMHLLTVLTVSRVSQTTQMHQDSSESKKRDRQDTACCAWPVAPAVSN